MREGDVVAMDESRLERDVEALLFASDTPLSAGMIATLTSAPSARRVVAVIRSLIDFYRNSNRSFTIVEVAGGYQLTTNPEFSGLVSRLYKGKKKSKLTQPALETLAIIAYKQPIGRTRIEAIRGVNCEGVLATLIERDLVSVSGRGEGIGKPFLYATTKKFLEYLGLKDFSELPNIEELERRFAVGDGGEKPLVPAPEPPRDAVAGGGGDER
jgi:segregation and condensation protein B